MEGAYAGFHPAYHCGHGAVLPGQIPVGRQCACSVSGFPDTVQPPADDLLLPARDVRDVRSIFRRCYPPQTAEELRQGHRRRCGCHRHCHHSQPLKSIPHLRVQQGDHARQKRTGHDREFREERALGRLHNPVVVRYRRDMDSACPKRQGRSICAVVKQRNSHEKRAVLSVLQLLRDVLGRPARHGRSGIRGGFRAVPVRFGVVCGERPDEMGSFDCYGNLSTPFVGSQLHGTYTVLH